MECAHEEDQLRQRGSKDSYWWTCLQCGSRWQRLEWEPDHEINTEAAGDFRGSTATEVIQTASKSPRCLIQADCHTTLQTRSEDFGCRGEGQHCSPRTFGPNGATPRKEGYFFVFCCSFVFQPGFVASVAFVGGCVAFVALPCFTDLSVYLSI